MHTGCMLYAHQVHTVCTPSLNQVHAWVQLHFRRLKQRQAALLGIPPHKFTSKL